MPGKKHGVRLCVAQVHFKSGARQDYVILANPGRGTGNKGLTSPASWEARSFADASVDFDLRNQKDALELERTLQEAAGG
jgi:hypothetical protein